tara:strand:+ start:22 stop:387 length:366 start_codon:yes stop_codon:yes gene_type:complete
MGMDVYGQNPRDEEKGAYFRNNVWYWHPLWDYVCKVCDNVITEEEHNRGHYNDGLLITEAQCKVIVKVLSEQLLNGETKVYEKSYTFGATPVLNNKDYPFTVENVKEFRDFAKECGGFRIS